MNADDDERLFGYYPTLAGETETYLSAKAAEEGLLMDGQPLVRFIVDEGLRHGKFDVVAEPVAAPLIAQLRAEEMARYGIGAAPAANRYGAPAGGYAPQPQAAPYADGYDQPAYDDYAEGDGYSDYDDYDGYDGYDDYDNYDDDQPFESQEEPSWAEPPMNRGESFAGAGAAIAVPQQQGHPRPWSSRRKQRAASSPAPSKAASLSSTRRTARRSRFPPRASSSDASPTATSLSPISTQAARTPSCASSSRAYGFSPTSAPTNGTLVNGRQITSQVLQGGERIVMGTTNLQFVIG